jgi:hypothetical protein
MRPDVEEGSLATRNVDKRKPPECALPVESGACIRGLFQFESARVYP